MTSSNTVFRDLNLVQGTQEWLDARLKHITATEVAHLMCGKISLYSLVEAKRGNVPPEDLSKNPAIKEGKFFEPLIRKSIVQMFPSLLGKDETDLPQPCVESIDEPFFMASLDGYSYLRGVVVEIKNIFSSANARFEDVKKNGLKSKAIREYGYYYQVQWQLFVTGSKLGLLFFHHSNNGKTFCPHNLIGLKIERNEKVIAQLKELALKVKQALSNNEQIAPSQGDEVHLSQEQELAIAQDLNEFKFIEATYKQATEMLASLKDQRQRIIDRLSAKLLGDNLNKIVGSSFTLNRFERKGTIDYEKFLIDQKIDTSLLDSYRKPSSVGTKLTLK